MKYILVTYCLMKRYRYNRNAHKKILYVVDSFDLINKEFVWSRQTKRYIQVLNIDVSRSNLSPSFNTIYDIELKCSLWNKKRDITEEEAFALLL